MEKLLQKPLGGPNPPLPNTVRVLHCDECDRVINADVEIHYVDTERGLLQACSTACKSAIEADEHRHLSTGGVQ